MTLYRKPTFHEAVRCYQCYAPYEGNVWVVESENGGTIARAFAKEDFNTLFAKYQLTEKEGGTA